MLRQRDMGGHLRRSLVAVLIGLAVAACSLLPSFTGESSLVRQRQQAQAALARWADAVKAAGGQQAFVPVGELYGQVGDWEEPVGDNNKRALMAGAVVAETPLRTDTPPDAEIRWDVGTTRTVHVMSAAATLEALRASGAQQDCLGCTPLQVTSATLTTATQQTSRGPATAPAWEFAIEGTKVLVTRIAVDPHDGVTVSPPPWDLNNPLAGIWIQSATGNVGGKELTVQFTGARQGNDPCSADYTAEAVESDLAVVVIVIEHPGPGVLLPGQGCDLVGYGRTATVGLASPLGDRAVLEVTQGMPVPVTLTS